jgi:hypothetical protein
VREREKRPAKVLTTTRTSGGDFWRRGSDEAASWRRHRAPRALMAAADRV